jgi:hypothetical protein
MRCRVCQGHVRGDCADVIPLVGESSYALMVNCRCGASLCFSMWLSESEAVQRDYEEQRYQAHRTALTALTEARRSGAAYAVIRRLERREERLAYSE